MTQNPDGTVTLTKAEYDELLEDSAFLLDLQGAGVDNWEGYDFACEARSKRLGEKE